MHWSSDLCFARKDERFFSDFNQVLLEFDLLERRQQARHLLSLLANFQWTDEQGVERAAEGFTRDICSKGIFIYADSALVPKTDLRLEVSLSSGGNSGVRIRASALILRVEPPMSPERQGGFATLIKSYELLRGEAVIEED